MKSERIPCPVISGPCSSVGLLRNFAAGLLSVWVGVVLLSGCSVFLSSATVDMTDGITLAILDNNDPATVEAGAPAYLLMVDGLIRRSPGSEALLRAGATIYTAYADVFVKDPVRAAKMTDKALDYALRAVCAGRGGACSLRGQSFQDYQKLISSMPAEKLPSLFALGSAWAAWIQVRHSDWNAIADLSRVEEIMQRVLVLDECYRDGAAHLYLGVLASLLPPALGGKPGVARQHFENALEISGRRNLMAMVMYARYYARLVFDRDLHDRLLKEVLTRDPNVAGYTLANTLAQQQARELLQSAADYF